ncbi:cellulose synthase [Nocardiopsis sp. CNR-923]|uniref:cellulose synthase n=1 Tax=Nocardiopsis sp. CNR-923 TaxID=1904965 RepID=UPI000961CB7C|nr:cellulose synthase [Nocardiopsis sp. CNR-923]OLT29234.1 cellulose synthase [Nocardiopsis sp. CNR-923]
MFELPENLPVSDLAVGAVLTGLGLIVSFLLWRWRGAASGVRGMAWSLVPLAVALLGLMSVVWEFVRGVAGVVTGLLFSPLVWAGVVLSGLAVVLYVASGVMRSRGVGTAPRSGKGTSAEGAKAADAAKGSGGPAAGAGGAKPQVGSASGKKAAPADDLSDLGDIEELLRKRGID